MTGTAAEPLIHNDNELNECDSYDSRDFNGIVDESALQSPSAFILALTFGAGVSGLLFGYDTGVVSASLISIGADLSRRPLSTLDKSLITSCTSLFALIASPIAGILADSWGRKKVILLCDVLFVLGALWQAFTGTIWGMIGGRSVVGLALGGACISPLYISELAPSQFRGRLITISALFITGGQVVAYLTGFYFSVPYVNGWRWMVGLGAVPAAAQFLTLGFMPETPRWLVKANQKERAKRVLVQVYGSKRNVTEIVDAVLRRIERDILEEEDAARERLDLTPKSGWGAKLARVTDNFAQLIAVGGNQRALLIACLLQGAQQLCGFNSLMYFSATIFALVGFKSPTLTSLSIAGTNFAFTLVAFHSIDRIGRRRILLYSIPIMVLGLALCALAFNFVDLTSSAASRTEVATNSGVNTWPLVILIAMITYVSGYAIGMGNVPWQQSELFPLAVRSLGSGIATATNWGSNFLIGISFLPMMLVLGPVATFALYAAICAISWVIIYNIYPETAGLSLEDVGVLLKDGWGVEESMRRAGERMRGSREGGTCRQVG